MRPPAVRVDKGAFKRPKCVVSFIAVWNLMDSVIKATKRGRAVTYWKQHSVPVGPHGEPFFVNEDVRIVRLRYSHVIVNPYWYMDFFKQTLPDYDRIYGAFVTAMEME